MAVEVGLGVVLLDVELVVAREQLPVQVPQIVARQILAMRGEFDRESDVRAAVQPVQKTLDDRARDQLEVVDLGEHDGIEVFVHQLGAAEPAFGLSAGLVFAAWPGAKASRPRAAFHGLAGRYSFVAYLLDLSRRDDFDQPADQVVGIDSLGPGVEIQHQAMAQYRQCHRANVGKIDVESARQNCQGLGA